MKAEDYIRWLAEIPEELWCIGEFQDRFGNRCAIGHVTNGKGDWSRLHELRNMVKPGGEIVDIADINNNPIGIYQQESIKERVLTALFDARDAGL